MVIWGVKMNETGALALEVRKAATRYRTFTALHKISLGIRDTEFFTLPGPQGCGKPTWLPMIAGFEDVTEGAILLFGEEIAQLPPHKRPINTAFQTYALFPHLPVLGNVGVSLEMKRAGAHAGGTDAGAGATVAIRRPQACTAVGWATTTRGAGSCACPLAPSVKEVLLLDEPLSALNLKLRKAMQIELKHIQRETGITFIFVTHHQEETLAIRCAPNA